jgi:hypothetical protein
MGPTISARAAGDFGALEQIGDPELGRDMHRLPAPGRRRDLEQCHRRGDAAGRDIKNRVAGHQERPVSPNRCKVIIFSV